MTMRPTRLLYVVGARPNFVKMAPVISELRNRLPDAEHALVHTGQHYDSEMSQLFLDQLRMPEPDHWLNVGSGTHAEQTARVMTALESVVVRDRPDFAFIPGDVNSTLAAALVFAKLNIPYAHVEAGLRSRDLTMPEEINRIVADEFATLLFTHSQEASANLLARGFADERVHLVGNTMIDTLVYFEQVFRSMHICSQFDADPGTYLLVTLHRPSLVDGDQFDAVLRRLDALGENMTVIFPVHPRSRARLDETRYPRVRFAEPLGYLEFLSLQADARCVLTDSGGVQEESTYLGVPCFTFRTSTERPVTISEGTNTLLGVDPQSIDSLLGLLSAHRSIMRPPDMWDGRAAQRLADTVEAHFSAASTFP
jgi:UDP-N-acetylglucosamine 2-epimerase (non-hydrolysing)